MNEKLQEIIDYTNERFGLDNYYLKRHHFFREKNGLYGTSYLLNMEWFPNDAEQTDEDYNPEGTASIDIDIHTKAVQRVIFVQDVSYANQEIFSGLYKDSEKTIEWVEEMTGLEFGRQFQLVHEAEGTMIFQAAVDNITVYPVGTIEVEFNKDGQLTLFSIDGSFPNEEQIQWEPFTLTPDVIDPIAKAQCKLLEIPVEDEEKWVSVFGATTIFLMNDGKRIISYEEVENQTSYVKKDVVMDWKAPIDEPFTPADIDLSLEVSEDEALANEPHPALSPDDQKRATEEARRFLQRLFPANSGKWRLTGLRHENGYIFAELKPTVQDNRVIEHKLQVIIDRENYEVQNYIDNRMILDLFKHFKSAEEPVITQEQAFEKLRKHIEVTPVYIYNKEQESYILCGKVDCGYGVDAVTGEVVLLDEL